MVSTVLIDTDVVSYNFKRDSRSELYRPLLVGKILLVSFMTVAEIDRWTLSHNWGVSRRAEAERYMTRYGVIPAERDICSMWAKVSDDCKRRGRPIECADAWIAATALVYRIPLVTHNVKDYAYVQGLQILSA